MDPSVRATDPPDRLRAGYRGDSRARRWGSTLSRSTRSLSGDDRGRRACVRPSTNELRFAHATTRATSAARRSRLRSSSCSVGGSAGRRPPTDPPRQPPITVLKTAAGGRYDRLGQPPFLHELQPCQAHGRRQASQHSSRSKDRHPRGTRRAAARKAQVLRDSVAGKWKGKINTPRFIKPERLMLDGGESSRRA